ncbi:MAG: hypothetical protein KDB53_09625, partial [Planctomycetes bacterium]|nr:hypothetical protein [Planctomycetota bacterium]
SVEATSRLVRIDDEAIYLSGDELNVYDRSPDRSLVWSRLLDPQRGRARIIGLKEGLFVLTRHGGELMDYDNGDTRSCVDFGKMFEYGGEVVMDDERIVLVSSRGLAVIPLSGPVGTGSK